jgi:hypothetical protein
MTIPLNERAVLVNLKQSCWGNTKTDKRASQQVTAQNHAQQNAARVVKKLIESDGAYKRLKQSITACYNLHYALTQPWGDNKLRIVAVSNLMSYQEQMAAMIEVVNQRKPEFIREYEQIVTDGMGHYLGDLYNPRDYPHPSEMSEQFGVKITILPVPSAGDFRLQLADGETEAIKQALEDESKKAVHEAMRDTWNKVYAMIKRMADNLQRPESKVYDSLISNPLEMAQMLPGLNLTDDPRLEQLRKDIVEKLCAFDVETIKKDKNLKASLGQTAQEVLDGIPQFESPVRYDPLDAKGLPWIDNDGKPFIAKPLDDKKGWIQACDNALATLSEAPTADCTGKSAEEIYDLPDKPDFSDFFERIDNWGTE